MLAARYLHIRLPAEVTLPRRDYPRPTIFSLSSSYRSEDVPFPGTSGGGQPQIPNESRNRDHQRTPRPRPLFIDKPLPSVAKEDPSTYALFIEGVVLLAYNIAWLCCSQGVSIGDKDSFEDVCNMGRNMYNLLIGNQVYRNPTGRIFPVSSSAAPNSKDNDDEPGEIAKATASMGRYSHGAAHFFLGSADGNEFVRGFKLPTPVKLADRLKRQLSTETPLPDWEILEDDFWAPEDNCLEDGVLVKDHRRRDGDKDKESERRSFGVESVMTVRTAVDTPGADGSRLAPLSGSAADKARSSGTSGWTKLKSR